MFHRSSAGNFAIALTILVSVFLTHGQARPDDTAPVSQAPVIQAFERFARRAFAAAHNDDKPAGNTANNTAEVSDLQRAELERAGRLLLTELSCTACHASQWKELEAKSGPNLQSVGLRLQAAWIAAYLDRPQQMKPGSTMPDMLAGIPAANKPRVVAALTAYLVSQQTPFPVLKASGANPVPHEFWNKGNAATGKQMFHKIGCVACHEPAKDVESGVRTSSSIEQLLETLEPEEIEKLGLSHKLHAVPSVPLPNARDKYTRQGLAMFLFDPSVVRTAGRMPGFKLRTADAADITAYLMARESEQATTDGAKLRVDGALRDEGKRLFTELRCVNCHVTKENAKSAQAAPLARLNTQSAGSCIAAQARPALPHYSLDALQRSAVSAALATERTRTQPPASSNSKSKSNGAALTATLPAAESVQLIMQQLNCYACHERNSAGGVARGRDGYFETVGQVDLGDEGRLPPPLTGVGAKLNKAWLKTVFQGNGEVRPHLEIRMPKFPLSEVEPLIALLAADDADFLSAHADKSVAGSPSTSSSTSKKQLPADKSLAEAGRTIFNLGCVQCHPIRGEALPSVIGVDVGRIGRRIERAWFDQFLLNPASLKPRTRMPTFFAPGSVNQEILGGDVNQQIAAVWSYLEDIDRQPLPEKIEQARRQNFELVPQERPIVLRTFMQLAGTHAIAVGFPQQVHYAFDAESVRLAELWSGRFLDAQGTWNDRFAPEAMPLTQQRLPLPKGPDLALLASKNPNWPDEPLNSAAAPSAAVPRFDGYRLNKQGVPEFLYTVGDYAIVDRLLPLSVKPGGEKTQGMQRELVISRAGATSETKVTAPVGSQLWLRAAASGKPLQRAGNSLTYASGLTVTLPAPLMSNALLRSIGPGAQCLIPISSPMTVVLEYRWK